MNRDTSLEKIANHRTAWDMAIIGGGATGMGIALDAASRGYNVALFEQSDFGKGTSSRSTKLVHGGVRYLQQGNVALVTESLHERGIMRQNAPHLVHELPFVVPDYAWWEGPFYGIGMKVYDMLAGKYSFGRSKMLSKEETLRRIPTLEQKDLRGGVVYYDGQFDDARMLINIAETAREQGATLLNYAEVIKIIHNNEGLVEGLVFRDIESGKEHTVYAKCVINATGPFSDKLRHLDDTSSKPMIAPSQGVHLVLDRSFLSGDTAIMVPHTSDGRVMFAIPWHKHVVLGTTDTPVKEVVLEPRPMEEEIKFILETASKYLDKNPTRADILSAYAGIRPLVHDPNAKNTAALSRDYTIHIEKTGLISIAGGKWTTYRKMAEDCVDHAAVIAGLEERTCVTKHLNIHGYHEHADEFGELQYYGSDATALQDLIASDPALGKPLHEKLPITSAQTIWAVQNEMARTLDDVLARRTRSLLLGAEASIEVAPKVAKIMAIELHKDENWQKEQVRIYTDIARGYLVK